MPKYKVVAREVWDYYMDADSPEEAIRLADEESHWYRNTQQGFETVSVEEVKDEVSN